MPADYPTLTHTHPQEIPPSHTGSAIIGIKLKPTPLPDLPITAFPHFYPIPSLSTTSVKRALCLSDVTATLGRFSDYYRDFQCIARWLLTNSKLYRNEEHRLFQQGIPMSLWSKLIRRLKITLPNHHPEDPYNVDQVFEGAKWILKGMDTSTTKTSNGTSGIPSSSPIANTLAAPVPTPK
ncbi:hypothetical protein E4T56_gene2882 [Termitomyces sp. T112]|nr:hypothetical protein E4T56_gene2882 [Termitomyces sp. T112]